MSPTSSRSSIPKIAPRRLTWHASASCSKRGETMSTQFNVEKENARFLYIFRRVLTTLAVLVCLYLATSTYAILRSNSGYLHDWRGAICILLTAIVFLL